MIIVLESEININDVLLHPIDINDHYETDTFFASAKDTMTLKHQVQNKEDHTSESNSWYGENTSCASPQFYDEYVQDSFGNLLNDEPELLKTTVVEVEDSSFSTFLDDRNDSSYDNILSPQSPCPKAHFESEKHIGNNRFYIQISIFRQSFMEAFHMGNRAECDAILKRVIDSVCCYNPPGRFLELVPLGQDEFYVDIGTCKATMRRVEAAFINPPLVALSQFLYHEHEIDAGALFKNEIISDDVTLPTETTSCSKTMSLASIRQSFLPSRNMNSCIDTSYTGTESQFGNETSSMFSTCQELDDSVIEDFRPTTKRKKTGMRRRGLISSDEPTKKNEMMKKYKIGEGLRKVTENLIQNVIDNTTEDGNARDFDRASNLSGSSEDVESKRAKRSRSITMQSVCSSTSSLGGLRSDFANNLKVDSFSRPRVPKRTRQKKTTSANKYHVPTSDQSDFHPRIKVKVYDEVTNTTQLRSLSRYDVLCTHGGTHLALKECNHVGNNRLRTMLLIFQARYNSKDISPQFKNRLIHCILQHTLHGKKGQTRFVFQALEQELWTQIPNEAIPKFVVSCLEECPSNPRLCVLPPFREKDLFWSYQNRPRGGRMTSKDVQANALFALKKGKKMKPYTMRDASSVKQLQDSVLKES
eukprot:scaffold10261_cov269-Chaetoceros_neogracile.AAC.11